MPILMAAMVGYFSIMAIIVRKIFQEMKPHYKRVGQISSIMAWSGSVAAFTLLSTSDDDDDEGRVARNNMPFYSKKILFCSKIESKIDLKQFLHYISFAVSYSFQTCIVRWLNIGGNVCNECKPTQN